MAPVSINLSCLHRQNGFCEFLWRQWSPLSLFCEKPIQRLPKTAPDNDQLEHLELIFIDIMQSAAECSSPWVWLGGSCSNLFACKIICFCSETSRPKLTQITLTFARRQRVQASLGLLELRWNFPGGSGLNEKCLEIHVSLLCCVMLSLSVVSASLRPRGL